MAGAVALGRQIAFVMRVGGQDVRHALDHRDSGGLELSDGSLQTVAASSDPADMNLIVGLEMFL